MAKKKPRTKLAIMTEDEVRVRYRQAADKHSQIGILADLNAVDRSFIEKILFEGTDETPPPAPAKKQSARTRLDAETQEKIAREHLEDGVSVKELAEKYGRTTHSITNYINKYSAQAAADQPVIPGTVPYKKQPPDPVKRLGSTMSLLFDSVNALMERAERDCESYDEIIITKSNQRISCFMEKDGISVSISKDIGTSEGGAGDAGTAQQ